jgi:hypothetical protein
VVFVFNPGLLQDAVSGVATGINASPEADLRLVNIDSATFVAKGLCQITGTQGFAYTVSEKPRALVLDFENAVQLVGADALLAGHDQVNGLQHLGEGQASVFKHSANLDGELLATLTALFETVAHLAFGVLLGGLGTNAR